MITTVKKAPNWLPTIFNDLMSYNWLNETESTPAVNIKENESNYTIEVAAPGMCKNDCKISINEQNHITITMEKSEEEKHDGETFLRKGFSFTKFSQSFVLPNDVDKNKISAKESHGILSITLPKFDKDDVPDSKRIIEIE